MVASSYVPTYHTDIPTLITQCLPASSSPTPCLVPTPTTPGTHFSTLPTFPLSLLPNPNPTQHSLTRGTRCTYR